MTNQPELAADLDTAPHRDIGPVGTVARVALGAVLVGLLATAQWG